MRGLEAERVCAKVRSRLFRTAEAPVKIDRYLLEARVGEGGMGTVYRARDPQLMRDVAVKLLKPIDAEDKLLEEARAMAKLEHPNVLAIHDMGTHQGQVFLVMKYVDGQNLGRWLEQVPPPREVAKVFAAAARGVAALHQAGVVHRDFKPENVLIDRTGRVVVADFGLARENPEVATPVGAALQTQVAGTPSYMAPELLDGARATARSDQFAFCVALHEALHGVRPFQGATLSELRAALTRPATRGSRSVPRWLQRIVTQGLERDPAGRFASMDEIAAALEKGPSPVRLIAFGAAFALAVLALALMPRLPSTEPAPVQLGRGFVDVFDEAYVAVRSVPFRDCYDDAFSVSVRFDGSGAASDASIRFFSGVTTVEATQVQRECLLARYRKLRISPFDTEPRAVHTVKLRWIADEDGTAPYAVPKTTPAATERQFSDVSDQALAAVKAADFAGCYRGTFSMALRFTENGDVLEAKFSAGEKVTAEQRECVLKAFRAVKVPPFNRRYLTDDAVNVLFPARP